MFQVSLPKLDVEQSRGHRPLSPPHGSATEYIRFSVINCIGLTMFLSEIQQVVTRNMQILKRSLVSLYMRVTDFFDLSCTRTYHTRGHPRKL